MSMSPTDAVPANLSKSVVILRVYDLSKGQVARFSHLLMTKPIDGVWHTALEVFGYEYFYGGNIGKARPQEVEESLNMKPAFTKKLGRTTKSMGDFDAYLFAMYDQFTPESYHLVTNNCNNFTNTAAKYLLDGRGIPQEILNLPQQVQNSVVGRIVLKVLQRVQEGQNPVLLGDVRQSRPSSPDHLSVRVIPFDCMSERSDKAVHGRAGRVHMRAKSAKHRGCLSLPPADVSPPPRLLDRREGHRRQHTTATSDGLMHRATLGPADMFLSSPMPPGRRTVPTKTPRDTPPPPNRSSFIHCMSTTDGYMTVPPFVLSSRGTTAKRSSTRMGSGDAGARRFVTQPSRGMSSVMAVTRNVLTTRPSPSNFGPSKEAPSMSPLAPRRPFSPRMSEASIYPYLPAPGGGEWLIPTSMKPASVFPSATFRASTRAS